MLQNLLTRWLDVCFRYILCCPLIFYRLSPHSSNYRFPAQVPPKSLLRNILEQSAPWASIAWKEGGKINYRQKQGFNIPQSLRGDGLLGLKIWQHRTMVG